MRQKYLALRGEIIYYCIVRHHSLITSIMNFRERKTHTGRRPPMCDSRRIREGILRWASGRNRQSTRLDRGNFEPNDSGNSREERQCRCQSHCHISCSITFIMLPAVGWLHYGNHGGWERNDVDNNLSNAMFRLSSVHFNSHCLLIGLTNNYKVCGLMTFNFIMIEVVSAKCVYHTAHTADCGKEEKVRRLLQLVTCIFFSTYELFILLSFWNAQYRFIVHPMSSKIGTVSFHVFDQLMRINLNGTIFL